MKQEKVTYNEINLYTCMILVGEMLALYYNS